MPAFWSTNWTGKPELHKIVNVDDGRTHYFFDQAPKARTIEESGFDDDHPGLTRTRQLTGDDGGPSYEDGGYYSGTDINKVRQEWQRQFPGVAFPDASTATPGAGINAQGNGVPGQFSGNEAWERGNAGHGSWWDQQGTELMGDALFAGAGYAGGGLAGAMMSYGLGGDTSAESQRSLRAGAAGGLVGSIFGTPSTAASNTPSDASGVPADSVPVDSGATGSTVSGSEGNPAMTGSAGNDTLTSSDPYGTGVDANGNPTGQYANGTGNSLNLGNSNFWGPVGSALISGYLGSEASKKAAGTMADASRSVVDMQKGIYDTTRSDLSPYRTAGMPALQQLSYLTGLSPQGVNGETGNSGALLKPFDYSMVDLYKDPSYQFRQSEGEKALTRGYASRGLAQSTPGLKSLMTFNQGLASTEYGNAFSRAFGVDSANKERTTNVLMGLAGIGQNAAAGTASAGIATGNTAANALITGAQAGAAGITGSASAYNNAIQGGLSNYLYQQRFDQMMQRMPVFNSGGGSTARAY